ncbi:MAG: chromosome segregation protein SMC [Planctomycetia bacterium]|nr:chromosome segregation protein SMC [Planctomycetia bacterium]
MLKSLDLFGFKSFADRTRFDFAPGITCVVGPNGSGKSNVVDSIKWILGDQSPKSLRGKEMTDVIFNGSANRKPAPLAEALLNFDNSRRVLALDADEVQIGRRIYRSGESEYLINRVPARLKDIRDLFLGTGAGSSAYSIIEQGRVDQLLQATNINRRNVFEEAAGVSRYKARKVDAQRKLERVAQNLLRLTDIVKEVESQLLALRSQAAKAAKYREYTHELRQLRIGSAADDYRSLGAKLSDNDVQRQALESEIEACAAEARDCEAQQAGAESQLAESEDRLRHAERREAENRESIAGFEATVKHQTARRQELEADYQRLLKQQAELAERVHEVVGEFDQTVVDLEKYQEEFEHRRAALAGAEATIGELAERVAHLRSALEQARGELLESVRELSAHDSRATTLEAQRNVLEDARRAATARLVEMEQRIAACRDECSVQTKLVDAAASQHAGLRDELQAVQNRRGVLASDQIEARQKLSELREQRGAVQARRGLLEEFERRQEGLGVGVKEILALARESDEAPWNHVLGHVVELLEVDIENAALLEVALGARAQLIVLDEGRPLIEHLADGKCRLSGRVGFVAMAADPATADVIAVWPAVGRAPGIDLSGRPGVVCRADRLVRSASGIHHLPERLLADTWIVTSLDVALALAAATGEACRFVTQQGELLEADGTLFAGSLRGDSALVSRKSELRGIKNDLARLDHQIASTADHLERMVAETGSLAQQEQQFQFDLDVCAHSVAALRSALSGKELDLERVVRQHADAQADLDQASGRLEELCPQWEVAHEERDRLEARQSELQARIGADEQELTAGEARLSELQALFAAEQLDIAKFEERLQNLESARTRLDQERFQRDLHREEADRRLQMLSTKRDQIGLELLNTNAVLHDLAAQKELLAADVGQLQLNRDFARSRRGELAERELQVRHRLRDLKDRQHAIEMQSTEIRHQIAGLENRLRDEFQVELTELAASGATAREAIPSAGEVPLGEQSDETATHGESGAGDGPIVDVAAAPQLSDEEHRAQVEEQINKLRRKLKALGQVNTDSLQELDELETRFARLSGQLQDLVEAKNTLEEIIRRINVESKRLFLETFAQIRQNFQELFRKLFGGGEGDVMLEDMEDVLECGIDVVARPPGKELRSISLLSGGEKTMTAVAMLLAIFKSKPSPFCILDEVDAALDEGNVNRYLGVIKEFQEWTQFIVVTHHKRTMAGADVLYGVTMEEAGVSKRMSVRFEDISEDGHFKTPAAGPSPAEATTAA